MLNVIDYMPGDTLLHKLNPVAKVALAASIIAATFLSNSYAMLVGLLAFTLLMGAYAGVVGRLVVLMKLLVPLALILFVLQVLFMRAGTPVFGFATDEGGPYYGQQGVPSPARRGDAAVAHAHGYPAWQSCERLRREAAYSVSLCVHVYHGAAFCAYFLAGNECHHGGPNRARRRIRYEEST